MDNSHCCEIHYHLARALMHLNSLAGFLPFFEPAVDWEDHEADFYRRPSLPSPHHRRHLHTFVPIPPGPSIPSLSSHGGMPTHMALNPEPNLRPLSICRGPDPLEDSRPANASIRVGSSSPVNPSAPAPVPPRPPPR